MEEKTHTPLQPIMITIILFIVLCAVAATFFFLGKAQSVKTSTQTPPSPSAITWKTYSNAKYNYSVEYPGEWVAAEFPDSKTGASFGPLSSTSITISAGQALLNYRTMPFEEYVKIAGTEIQNYDKLATINKVVTTSGVEGYTTTWMVRGAESLPITYFAIPGNKTDLVRVTLDKKEDLAVYEKMIASVKISAPLIPEPTEDETALLKNVIKKYIALKHKSDEGEYTITVSQIDGVYAKGGVNTDGGGGMWFAIKEDGVWKLVWDGNGIIECSTFDLYPTFSKTMIPECYDSTKQDVVKR